jgi:hypothetical protein
VNANCLSNRNAIANNIEYERIVNMRVLREHKYLTNAALALCPSTIAKQTHIGTQLLCVCARLEGHQSANTVMMIHTENARKRERRIKG